MKRRVAMLGLALVAGCVGRSLPLPPPGATIQSVTRCSLVECPEGGLIVTIRGLDALPGATVVVHDLRMSLELGQRPAALVRADAHGAWTATLRALRVPGRLELPIFPGDELELFQKDGDEASAPTRVTVPTPPRDDRTAPIIEGPEPTTPTPGPSAR